MHQPAPRIVFSVDLSRRRAHLFTVTMSLDGAAINQKLSLPVWTPGSYMVREFAQHVVSLRAYENGREINVAKIDKNTFELSNVSSSIAVVYEMYGFDSSIRAAFIDGMQAFFNGCALFFRPHGCENEPFQVTVIRPPEQECAAWQIATGMAKLDVDAFGFGSYRAADYDELVDCPFQIGEMARHKFVAASIPHEIVLVGDRRPFDENRLVRDLTKLCETQIKLFDGAPFSSYIFIARFEEGGYGGLEHRNSSMLLSSPYALPQDHKEPNANYRSFLGLCSHEYFHAWNIKQLKPKSFIPFDYDRECYTTMLWLFEGITSYYDDLCVRRAGLISLQNYLEMMGKNYCKLLRNGGRQLQSLAQSSFDAWIKFYRPNENSQNVTTSYYLKGSFIGLYLDLLIRKESEDKASLDDVMRLAYQRYGAKGITEEEFFQLLEEVSGISGAEFSERFIYRTEDLPLASVLESMGITLEFSADELSIDDKTKMQAFLGVRLRCDDNGRASIVSVEQEGPAMIAALSPGDEVLAINNIRFDASNMTDQLATIKSGQTVEILYSRKRMVQCANLETKELPRTQCKWQLKSELSQSERDRLYRWLD